MGRTTLAALGVVVLVVIGLMLLCAGAFFLYGQVNGPLGSTCRYRKTRALRAWFWVDAETCCSTARCARKARTSTAPMESGWRTP